MQMWRDLSSHRGDGVLARDRQLRMHCLRRHPRDMGHRLGADLSA